MERRGHYCLCLCQRIAQSVDFDFDLSWHKQIQQLVSKSIFKLLHILVESVQDWKRNHHHQSISGSLLLACFWKQVELWKLQTQKWPDQNWARFLTELLLHKIAFLQCIIYHKIYTQYKNNSNKRRYFRHKLSNWLKWYSFHWKGFLSRAIGKVS